MSAYVPMARPALAGADALAELGMCADPSCVCRMATTATRCGCGACTGWTPAHGQLYPSCPECGATLSAGGYCGCGWSRVRARRDHAGPVEQAAAAMSRNDPRPERAVLRALSDDMLRGIIAYHSGPFYVR